MHPYAVRLSAQHHAAWHEAYTDVVSDLEPDQRIGPEFLSVLPDGTLQVLAPLFALCNQGGLDAPMYLGEVVIHEIPPGQWALRNPVAEPQLRVLAYATWTGLEAQA